MTIARTIGTMTDFELEDISNRCAVAQGCCTPEEANVDCGSCGVCNEQCARGNFEYQLTVVDFQHTPDELADIPF